MKKITRVSVSVIACFALAGFLCVVPLVAHKATAASPQSTAEEQSVSGKVTAIGKTSFTLSVSSANISNESPDSGSGAKAMTFQVDSNTTIDGNLQVGVDANVTYRVDQGHYVAINVRVGQ
jgi:hypothetical protein